MPTTTSVAVASTRAVSLTWRCVPTTRSARTPAAAMPGRKKPAVRGSRNGSGGPGRSQTAIDMRTIDVGQAIALKSLPDACPTFAEKRLNVSPTTLSAMPPASRNHGPFL